MALVAALATCARAEEPRPAPAAPPGLAECRRAGSETDSLVQAVLDVDDRVLQDFMPRLRALVPLAEACAPYARNPGAPLTVRACAHAAKVGVDLIDWIIMAATWAGPDDGTVEMMLGHVELDLLPEYDEAISGCFG